MSSPDRILREKRGLFCSAQLQPRAGRRCFRREIRGKSVVCLSRHRREPGSMVTAVTTSGFIAPLLSNRGQRTVGVTATLGRVRGAHAAEGRRARRPRGAATGIRCSRARRASHASSIRFRQRLPSGWNDELRIQRRRTRRGCPDTSARERLCADDPGGVRGARQPSKQPSRWPRGRRRLATSGAERSRTRRAGTRRRRRAEPASRPPGGNDRVAAVAQPAPSDRATTHLALPTLGARVNARKQSAHLRLRTRIVC